MGQFTYVEHGNARTTSPLEGGINNGIRHVLRNHRGMIEPHMKRAAEWFLTVHEIPIGRAYEMITVTPTVPEAPIDMPLNTQPSLAPNQAFTTQTSAPKKASGTEAGRSDAADTPEVIHTF